VNVLSDEVTEEDEEGRDAAPVSRRVRSPQPKRVSQRKVRGTSTRSHGTGTKWRPVSDETGEILSVTPEQMSRAETLAMEAGLTEEMLIENAGTLFSWVKLILQAGGLQKWSSLHLGLNVSTPGTTTPLPS
jgi:hypothetical protein